MRSPLCALSLALTLAGCATRPAPHPPLPPHALAEDCTLRVDAAPLRPGDRLVFEWVSTLGAEREVAELVLEVEELGTPGAPRDLSADALKGLEDLIEEWNQADLGVTLQHDVDESPNRLPTGFHRVSVAVRNGTASADKEVCEFPIVCEGRGLLRAGERIRARMAGGRATFSTPELLAMCFDGLATGWLIWSQTLLPSLPGLGDLEALIDKPGWLPWLFSSWSMKFPIWSGVALHDSRVQVPFVLRCGSKDVMLGLVELAAPTGPLCLCGGVTGFRLWRPTDPTKELLMRLVRTEPS